MIRNTFFIILILLFALLKLSYGKKVLVFDEEKGIIWVDEKAKGSKKKFKAPAIGGKKIIIEEKRVKVRRHVKVKKVLSSTYKKTGLKFYNGKDYAEAIKYFKKAWAKKKDPLYYFWIGMCYRKLKQLDDMAEVYQEIVDQYSKSNVADDALFYLAAYAQQQKNYQTATIRYREVVESYPSGESVVGKVLFREQAKKQLRNMNMDVFSRLRLLNYKDDTPKNLLREFQKDNQLSPTGTPGKRSVKLLIKKSDNIENELTGAQDESEDNRLKKNIYLIILGILLFVNILWGYKNIKTTNQELKRLRHLKSDL